jgi:hypothetical protein
MILSILMTVIIWLIKFAAKGTVDAVWLALKMVLKLIQMVPPDEYAKLAVTLESFLSMLVAKLGASHPAAQVLAQTK